MSQIYFVSDLHLGHSTILQHTDKVRQMYVDGVQPFRGGVTVDEHDAWVIDRLLSVKSNKRTVWYIMGDVAMDESRLSLLDRVPGRKILILGNHDLFSTKVYLDQFELVLGGFKKYGMWITHMPLHPEELRGKKNLHGHCHHHEFRNPLYFNACIEWLPNNQPVSLDYLREVWLNES